MVPSGQTENVPLPWQSRPQAVASLAQLRSQATFVHDSRHSPPDSQRTPVSPPPLVVTVQVESEHSTRAFVWTSTVQSAPPVQVTVSSMTVLELRKAKSHVDASQLACRPMPSRSVTAQTAPDSQLVLEKLPALRSPTQLAPRQLSVTSLPPPPV